MLWNNEESYHHYPFGRESELEEAVNFVKQKLFGPDRIYLDDKRKIGAKGKTNNLPDAYLIDLTSSKDPKLFVVENDLSSHQHLKHIAVQILEFSLSYESSKVRVKNIIKEGLQKNPIEWDQCHKYAQKNGYDNVDYLLESIIQKKDSFNAMLIIDEVSEELETVLISRFKFPVEIITLTRYKSNSDKLMYFFQPFLHEAYSEITKIEPSEIDTIVVPAREDGFRNTFLAEDCWYAVRLHSSMIPKIKFLATYQVAPVSAITYLATVKSIEQFEDTNKYILHFTEKAKKINPVRLGKGKGKAPQSSRYTSKERLLGAKTLDDIF